MTLEQLENIVKSLDVEASPCLTKEVLEAIVNQLRWNNERIDATQDLLKSVLRVWGVKI